MGCTTLPRVQCALTYNTRSFWGLAMSVRPRQCGCPFFTWSAVLLVAFCSAGLGGVDAYRLCVGPGCIDGIGPSYKVDGARVRRAIADNDISQDTNSVDWKPADLDIVSEKLSIYQDGNGDYKAIKDVELESDKADSPLESTLTVDLKSEGSDNVDDEEKIVYSYPYVVLRRIGEEKKVTDKEDPIIKDGNSYIIYGDYKEHTGPLEGPKSPNENSHSVSDKKKGEDIIHDILHNFFKSITRAPNEESTTGKRSDVSDASRAIKTALTVAKDLFTTFSEMHKKNANTPRESTNSGTLLNGQYREHRNPIRGYLNPWEWKSASESSGDVTKVDRLLASMVSDMVKGTTGRKISRTTCGSWFCPFAQRGRLIGTQSSSGFLSPDLLWLITMM